MRILKNVLLKLENNFEEIIRINEKTYKTLKIDEKVLTFETIMNLVIKYPNGIDPKAYEIAIITNISLKSFKKFILN